MITKPPSQKKIEELINKGGGSPKEIKKTQRSEKLITTPLRVSKGLLKAIEEKIKGPYGAKTRSRNSFIVDAIIQALEE